MAKKKQFLFVLSRPPHSSLYVQETLDMILTTAAFDQPTRILFINQGVYLLKKHQQPAGIGCKDMCPIFDVLSMYDVEDLYVETESLIESGLDAKDLHLDVKPVQRADIGALLVPQDVVINV